MAFFSSSAWKAVTILTSFAVFISPSAVKGDFMQGIVIPLDGPNGIEDYYHAGPPDGSNDIPGHYWELKGNPNEPKGMRGKHYNSGPFQSAKWWAVDEDDGALLYVVDGIIDTWTVEKAFDYFEDGYTHYHEFVKVSDGSLHPEKVVWYKHIAVKHFVLNGGPEVLPNMPHDVSPGIDYEFIPNYMKPYP